MAKTNSTTELGFEDKIWKAADLLRGNIDASARGTRKARFHCPAFGDATRVWNSPYCNIMIFK
jgi:hypothetical protein